MVQRILVPVDGSDLSDRAMAASLDLARQLGVPITGFIAEPSLASPSGARARVLLEDEENDADIMNESHAQRVLSLFEQRAREAGVPFEGVHQRVPRIDRAIAEAAESRGCDLIVMVTRGRGAFGEFLFGSHTKAVLAGCKLPLLVLR